MNQFCLDTMKAVGFLRGSHGDDLCTFLDLAVHFFKHYLLSRAQSEIEQLSAFCLAID